MSERRIYMDHGATTPLREEVLETMLPFLKEDFGNPSSIHSWGQEAHRAVETAREKVAATLGAEPDEIYFTSGGTEANNIAIAGTARLHHEGGHIITSAIEHPAVRDVCRELAQSGYRVTFLPVNRYGEVSLEELRAALTPDTFLISIMMANNEVGTLQPVPAIAALAREKEILFHTDAVQAVGQIPINLRELPVDFLSMSAHKINGPKGMGALYVRRGGKVAPLYRGGGQERHLRPGTENVPGIVGLGRALELAGAEMPGKSRDLTALRDRLIHGLLSIEDVSLNGHPKRRLPGNVNVSFRYIEGESILLSLDLKQVAASSGSACSAGSTEVSHVLAAMGLDPGNAHGSVRFTLGRGNTNADVDYLLQILPPIVTRLRRLSAYSREQEQLTGLKLS